MLQQDRQTTYDNESSFFQGNNNRNNYTTDDSSNTYYDLFVYTDDFVCRANFNRLAGTLKPQSNPGPLYSNTVIGTLAVDGWAVCYIWYSEEGPGRVVYQLHII